jgi:mono/diheme cytochrome c family protein
MTRLLFAALLAAGVALTPHALAAELDGKKTFKKRCANCHKIGQIGQGLKGLTAEERTRHLDRFLSAHHASNREERAAIINYMNEQLSR